MIPSSLASRRQRARALRAWFAALALGLASCSGGDSSTGPGPDPDPDPVPTALAPVAGNAQTVPALVPLRDSLVVRVTDQNGRAMADVEVAWRIVTGPGELLTANVRTDANGRARALAVPGEGTLEVEASSGALTPVRFNVTGALPATGTSHLGRAGYAEYRPGTLPIIISAPHGGTLEPEEIPVRAGGTQVRDADTADLAERIAAALEVRFGARPHLILFHLHRKMVDANREIVEAAEGHPLGEHAWREFQGMIGHARARVEADHGTGLYFDIHGHGHTVQRLELGYLLSAANLRLDDAGLDALAGSSSLAAVAGRGAGLSALMRGTAGFGTLLAGAGYPSVPSAQDPAPGEGEPYFTGGYNTQRWGSRAGGGVDGIQIEANRSGVRDTAENREAFAQALASAVATFLATWYGWGS